MANVTVYGVNNPDAAPVSAELNEGLSKALHAGASLDNAVDGLSIAFEPRMKRLQQLYKTLT